MFTRRLLLFALVIVLPSCASSSEQVEPALTTSEMVTQTTLDQLSFACQMVEGPYRTMVKTLRLYQEKAATDSELIETFEGVAKTSDAASVLVTGESEQIFSALSLGYNQIRVGFLTLETLAPQNVSALRSAESSFKKMCLISP